jgi:ATP phosphoribosyltransferase regulatory subunit
MLMDATLALCGIQDRHIDLGHVGVFRALAAHACLAPPQEQALFDALQRKSRDDVRVLLEQYGVERKVQIWLSALLDLSGPISVLDEAERRFTGAPEPVLQALAYLRRVVDVMARRPGAPTPHFDLAELSGYHYYTGIVFSVFVSGHGRAIAKGGRYDGIGDAFGRARAATGFGADLRGLLRLGRIAETALVGIWAPAEVDVAEVQRLREQGERVVLALPGDGAAPRDYGCDRVLAKKAGRWIVEPIN